ncbi:hypothetical protein [Acetanaerobacterium elongatum]|uniref:Bacteriophage holin of superfamily 6 (Holin_LLH) n=1 Tax=Acetanaerobacterium elongatum TaxID=258515 RepID=A0A1G9Z4V5_9FIRM|nr:hypothetical protein [Acetanaerobacterium elongatum]SDN15791.1 hypothetical protein SAMN05192585_11277 [Acetanaerobacterium elongatum]
MKKTAKRILALIMCLLLVGILMAPTMFAADTTATPAPPSNWGNFVSIILTVLLVVGGFFISYFKTSATLKSKAAGLIAEAENQYRTWTKAGNQKFEWVCDQLYSLIPPWLKPLITREVVGNIVQTVFNFIEDYAKQQLNLNRAADGIGKLNK